ncbi:MAG TPA: ABC transporter permease [Bryobacteraceae bacterium]|jgi:predicted permease
MKLALVFLMDTLLDLRYALRRLAANPGFTCAAVLTLALGIGANTAIYSVIDGVLLHPVPFPEPERLVYLDEKTGKDEGSISYLNLVDWQKQNQGFEGIAGWLNDLLTLTGRGEAEQMMVKRVSSNFFSVLRVQPLAGRVFTAEEDRRGGAPVVMLGEDFWRRRFGADPKMVGQTLTLNGTDYAVIGIVPSRVRLDREGKSFNNDVFVPLGQQGDPLFYERGVGYGTLGVGRLKAGVSVEQAQAEMSGIMANLEREYPDDNSHKEASLAPFISHEIGDLRPALLALGAAVGFVLLIACTNIANLTLARSAGRSQEFAVRIALGAGRGRLTRQLLTESVVLSLGAGALGILIADWTTDAALRVLPSALPAIARVAINSRVLWFSFGVSAVTGVLFGLVPALKASSIGLQESLKQGGRGAIRGRHRIQHALIVAEVALTMVLLVGAGLMMRSLQKIWNVNPGLNPDGVTVFYTGLSGAHAANPAAIRTAAKELNDRLSTLPGVTAASVEFGGLPFQGNTSLGFTSEFDPPMPKAGAAGPRNLRIATFYAGGPDYFKTMGIPLLRGRAFTPQDTVDHPLVLIVDEELARAVFPGQDALGKHLRIQLFGAPAEIIGIAGHVKHAGLDSDATAAIRSQMYAPYEQLPDAILPLATSVVTCVVRSNVATADLMKSVRREMASFDSERAVHSERSMVEAISDSLAKRRFSLMVLGAFAGLALVLAMIGIYGVVSYFVSQRTNEIGVRLALGARAGDIFLDVLGEGGKLGAIGVGLGLAGAAGLTRLMQSMLFGVSSTDVATFAGAAVALFGLTMVACYLPARRAVRIDPMAALRSE